MINYILADYKRISTRVPRVILLVIYQAVFIGYIIYKFNRAAGNFTSVNLVETSTYYIGSFMLFILFLADCIQSFSFDFRAKTVQVALGIGISRLKVVFAKLVQVALVMLTDLVITLISFGIVSAVLGISLAGHQINYVISYGFGTFLLAICSVTLLMPLIFRVQNMVLTMVGYFLLVPGFISDIARSLLRLAPTFLQRLQLDRYFHDSCCNLIQSNAIQGNFQLWPVIAVIIWFVIGIYLTWLVFRKMELDF